MKFFNSLPDLCLVTILSRIPLCDLIRNRRVCTKWKWLQSIVTAQIRSLTILVGQDAFFLIQCSTFNRPSDESGHILNDDGTVMYALPKRCPFSSLAFQSELETDSVLFLVAMFANVRTLKIALNQTYANHSMLMVAFLLRLMSPNVNTLEMFCDFKEDNDDEAIPQFVSRQLFNSINSLLSLKNLTLDFQNTFGFDDVHNNDPSDETTSVDLSIISQLDQFNFYSHDYARADIMFESLKLYAQPGSHPLRIQYGFYELNAGLSKLDQFEPQFCSRFTRLLTAKYSYIPSTQLNNFCNRFTSVTCVSFDMMDVTIRYSLNKLAQLTQLVHLGLEILFASIQPDELTHQPLAQLPSVKSLDLHIKISNHDNLSMLNMPWTFPNVQVIRVFMYNYNTFCDICEYNESEEEITPETNRRNILKNCFKRVLIPLQQCPKLHTVTSFHARPFEAAIVPLTKEDLMRPIELKEWHA